MLLGELGGGDKQARPYHLGRDEFGRQEYLGTPGQSPDFQARRSIRRQTYVPLSPHSEDEKQPGQPLRVGFGQRFSPIILKDAEIYNWSSREMAYESVKREVMLHLNHTFVNGEDLPELPINFFVTPSRADKAEGLTPFNWELGFPLEAGYDPEKREQVIKEMQGRKLDFAQAPIYLRVSFVLDEQPQYDVLRHSENSIFFNPEAVEFFRHMRLHVSFGTGGTLAAKPNAFVLNHGQLEFVNFFDADRGAFTTQDVLYKGGLPIYLPPITTLEEISPEEQIKHPERKPHPLIENIRATFIHLGEQPQDTRW